MVNLRETFHYLGVKRNIYFENFMEEWDLKLMEIEILVYLNEFPESNTFTEIMKSKGYAKSYVSKAITNLVEREYILKKGLEDNKKVYKLFLTEKSTAVLESYETCIKRFRKDAFEDIEQSDLEAFERVINKIYENLSEQ